MNFTLQDDNNQNNNKKELGPITRFLINNGIAKDEQSATKVMLISVAVMLVLIAIFLLINNKPEHTPAPAPVVQESSTIYV